MDWMVALELLERFQSLAVGIVGFGGVIFTLWFNARNAELQQKREKDSRADAVAALVQAELQILLGAMLAATNATRPEEGETAKFPRLKINFLPNVLDELGLLGPDLCRKVIGAFLTVENAMAKVSLFAESFEPEYLTVPRENFGLISKMYEGHTKPIKDALEALTARDSPNE